MFEWYNMYVCFLIPTEMAIKDFQHQYTTKPEVSAIWMSGAVSTDRQGKVSTWNWSSCNILFISLNNCNIRLPEKLVVNLLSNRADCNLCFNLWSPMPFFAMKSPRAVPRGRGLRVKMGRGVRLMCSNVPLKWNCMSGEKVTQSETCSVTKGPNVTLLMSYTIISFVISI